MSDRLADIKAALERKAGTFVWREDVRWLVAEVERLRGERDAFDKQASGLFAECVSLKADLAALSQRHAEAVERAWRDGAWAVCEATDLDSDVSAAVVARLASEAKARLT